MCSQAFSAAAAVLGPAVTSRSTCSARQPRFKIKWLEWLDRSGWPRCQEAFFSACGRTGIVKHVELMSEG